MFRDSRLYIDDILEAIKQIRTYTQDYNRETFASDRKTQDAVIRNLEVIGEAARNIPEKIRALESQVEWRKITGLRNILIHEYFGINVSILWDIVENRLKPLEEACLKLLAILDQSTEH